MIDRDGIERPDKMDAHSFEMPHKETKKEIKSKKQLHNPNIFLNIINYFLRIIIVIVLSPAFFICYRLTAKNRKELRKLKKQGVVMVCNHCHMMDVVFMATKLFPHNCIFTSIPENFDIPVLGHLIKMLNAMPIPKSMSGMRFFKEIVDESLQAKKGVLFLPEGSLWPYYRGLRPFKAGAFKFAVQNNAPVLPMIITMKIVYKSLKRKKYRIKYTFLPAVYPDNTITDQTEATTELKNRVYKNMSMAIEARSNDDIYTKRYRRQNKKRIESEKLNLKKSENGSV